MTAPSQQVFCRYESPTQTPAVAQLQQTSGEIWGYPASNSTIPCVKAYPWPLPPGQKGIEFTTPVPPDVGSSTPIEARWYPHTPGVIVRSGYVAIPATVI